MAIRSYSKNLMKSLGYISVDMAKKAVPNITNTAENVMVTADDAMRELRKQRVNMRRATTAINRESIFGAAGNVMKDIKSDLASGKFYSNFRDTSLSLDGDDLGWDDIDASYEDEEDPDVKESKKETLRNKLTSHENRQNAEMITKTVIGTGEAMMSQSKAMNTLFYSQNLKNFSTLNNNMKSINDNIVNNLAQMQALQTSQMENATNYYTQSIDIQKKQLSMLEEIKKSTEVKTKSQKRFGFDRVLNGDSFNMKEYKKYIIGNFNNEIFDTGDLSFLKSGIEMLVENKKAGGGRLIENPLAFIPALIMSGIVPKRIKKSVGTFDKMFENLPRVLLRRLGHMRGSSNGLAELIGTIFGVESDGLIKGSRMTSKYEKGPVPWDGKSKKALEEVIPGYLSQIAAAMTKEDARVFDYNTGTYRTLVNIKKEEIEKFRSYSKDAYSDFYRDASNLISKLDMDAKEKEKQNKYIVDMLEYMFKNDRLADQDTIDDIKKKKNVGDENTYAIAQAILDYKGKQNKSAQRVLGAGRLESTKSKFNNRINNDENQVNNWLYNNLLSINGKVNEKSINNRFNILDGILDVKDKHNNSLFDYLKMISDNTSDLSRNERRGGKSKANKTKKNNNNKNTNTKTSRNRESQSQKDEGAAPSSKISNVKSVKQSGKIAGNLAPQLSNSNVADLIGDVEHEKGMLEKLNISNKIGEFFDDSPYGQSITKGIITASSVMERILIGNDNGDAKPLVDVIRDIFNNPDDDSKLGKFLKEVEESNKHDSELKNMIGVLFDKAKKKFLENEYVQKGIKFGKEVKKETIDNITAGGRAVMGAIKGVKNDLEDQLYDDTSVLGAIRQSFVESHATGGKIGDGRNFQRRPSGAAGKRFDAELDFVNYVKSSLFNDDYIHLAEGTNKRKRRRRSNRVSVEEYNRLENNYNALNNQVLTVLSKGEAVLTPEELAEVEMMKQELNRLKGQREDYQKRLKPDPVSIKEYDEVNNNYHRLDNQVRKMSFKGEENLSPAELIDYTKMKDELDRIIKQLDDYRGRLEPNSVESVLRIYKVDEVYDNILNSVFGVVRSDDKREQDSKQLFGVRKEIFNTFKKKTSKVAAGGLTGALVSTGLGLVGGPLAGMAVGAGLSIYKNSENMKTLLFGDAANNKKGMIPPRAVDLFKKYFPDFKKYGLTSAALGLLPITPFGPVGGLMLGSAISFFKNNEQAQNELFGTQGILGPQAKKLLTEHSKKVLTGAALAALTGPFGLVGNSMMGASLALIASTDTFKTGLLGEKDENGKYQNGILPSLRDTVVLPLKDFALDIPKKAGRFLVEEIAKPIRLALDPIKAQITGRFKKIRRFFSKFIGFGLKNYIFVPMYKRLEDILIAPLKKAASTMFNAITGAIKKVVLAPVKLISSIGTYFKDKQIRKGDAVSYMTAGERLNYIASRTKLRPKVKNQLIRTDQVLQTANKEQLEKLKELVYTSDAERAETAASKRYILKQRSKAIADVSDKLSGFDVGSIRKGYSKKWTDEQWDKHLRRIAVRKGLTPEEFNLLNQRVAEHRDSVDRLNSKDESFLKEQEEKLENAFGVKDLFKHINPEDLIARIDAESRARTDKDGKEISVDKRMELDAKRVAETTKYQSTVSDRLATIINIMAGKRVFDVQGHDRDLVERNLDELFPPEELRGNIKNEKTARQMQSVITAKNYDEAVKDFNNKNIRAKFKRMSIKTEIGRQEILDNQKKIDGEIGLFSEDNTYKNELKNRLDGLNADTNREKYFYKPDPLGEGTIRMINHFDDNGRITHRTPDMSHEYTKNAINAAIDMAKKNADPNQTTEDFLKNAKSTEVSNNIFIDKFKNRDKNEEKIEERKEKFNEFIDKDNPLSKMTKRFTNWFNETSEEKEARLKKQKKDYENSKTKKYGDKITKPFTNWFNETSEEKEARLEREKNNKKDNVFTRYNKNREIAEKYMGGYLDYIDKPANEYTRDILEGVIKDKIDNTKYSLADMLNLSKDNLKRGDRTYKASVDFHNYMRMADADPELLNKTKESILEKQKYDNKPKDNVFTRYKEAYKISDKYMGSYLDHIGKTSNEHLHDLLGDAVKDGIDNIKYSLADLLSLSKDNLKRGDRINNASLDFYNYVMDNVDDANLSINKFVEEKSKDNGNKKIKKENKGIVGGLLNALDPDENGPLSKLKNILSTGKVKSTDALNSLTDKAKKLSGDTKDKLKEHYEFTSNGILKFIRNDHGGIEIDDSDAETKKTLLKQEAEKKNKEPNKKESIFKKKDDDKDKKKKGILGKLLGAAGLIGGVAKGILGKFGGFIGKLGGAIGGAGGGGILGLLGGGARLLTSPLGILGLIFLAPFIHDKILPWVEDNFNSKIMPFLRDKAIPATVDIIVKMTPFIAQVVVEGVKQAVPLLIKAMPKALTETISGHGAQKTVSLLTGTPVDEVVVEDENGNIVADPSTYNGGSGTYDGQGKYNPQYPSQTSSSATESFSSTNPTDPSYNNNTNYDNTQSTYDNTQYSNVENGNGPQQGTGKKHKGYSTTGGFIKGAVRATVTKAGPLGPRAPIPKTLYESGRRYFGKALDKSLGRDVINLPNGDKMRGSEYRKWRKDGFDVLKSKNTVEDTRKYLKELNAKKAKDILQKEHPHLKGEEAKALEKQIKQKLNRETFTKLNERRVKVAAAEEAKKHAKDLAENRTLFERLGGKFTDKGKDLLDADRAASKAAKEASEAIGTNTIRGKAFDSIGRGIKSGKNVFKHKHPVMHGMLSAPKKLIDWGIKFRQLPAVVVKSGKGQRLKNAKDFMSGVDLHELRGGYNHNLEKFGDIMKNTAETTVKSNKKKRIPVNPEVAKSGKGNIRKKVLEKFNVLLVKFINFPFIKNRLPAKTLEQLSKGGARKMAEMLSESVMKKLASEAGESALKGTAKKAARGSAQLLGGIMSFGVIDIAFYAWDIYQGWHNAAKFLRVSEDLSDKITIGLRFVSALFNLLSGITYGLIPTEVFISIYKFVASKIFGDDKLEKLQEESKRRLARYNSKHEAKDRLTLKEYNKKIKSGEIDRKGNDTKKSRTIKNDGFFQRTVKTISSAVTTAGKFIADGASSLFNTIGKLFTGGKGPDSKKINKYINGSVKNMYTAGGYLHDASNIINDNSDLAMRRAIAYHSAGGFSEDSPTPTRSSVSGSYFSQKDTRWGSKQIGGSNMSKAGCGPTSLAMTISDLTGKKITPDKVAKDNKENLPGYATWKLFPSAAKKYGLGYNRVAPNEKALIENLKRGEVVLSGLRSRSTKPSNSPFTNSGHIVVAKGLNNGKIQIADPRGRNYNKSYAVKDVLKDMTLGFRYSKAGQGEDLDYEENDNLMPYFINAGTDGEDDDKEKEKKDSKSSKSSGKSEKSSSSSSGSMKLGDKVVAFAREMKPHVRYKYGADNFKVGATSYGDCSSFTKFIFKQAAGVDLPRSSGDQRGAGKGIKISEVGAGDLAVYNGHVGIFTDHKGNVIHNSMEGVNVIEGNYKQAGNGKQVFPRRLLPDDQIGEGGVASSGVGSSSEGGSSSSTEGGDPFGAFFGKIATGFTTAVAKMFGLKTETESSGAVSNDGMDTSTQDPGEAGEKMKLNRPDNTTAAQIDAYLKKMRATSEWNGQMFKDAQKATGISPVDIMVWAALESNWGKSRIARTKHNYFGIGAVDNNPMGGAYTFSPRDGIVEGAKWINKHYVRGKYKQDNWYACFKGPTHRYSTTPSEGVSLAKMRANFYAWAKSAGKGPDEIKSMMNSFDKTFGYDASAKDEKLMKEYYEAGGADDKKEDSSSNSKFPDSINGFPWYGQQDPRWKEVRDIYLAGCGPTSFAMVATGATGKRITPVEVAKYAKSKGQWSGGGGAHSIFPVIAPNWGLTSSAISKKEFDENASNNRVQLILGRGGPIFGSGGHFSAILGKKNDKYLSQNPIKGWCGWKSIAGSEQYWDVKKDGKYVIWDGKGVNVENPEGGEPTTSEQGKMEGDSGDPFGTFFGKIATGFTTAVAKMFGLKIPTNEEASADTASGGEDGSGGPGIYRFKNAVWSVYREPNLSWGGPPKENVVAAHNMTFGTKVSIPKFKGKAGGGVFHGGDGKDYDLGPKKNGVFIVADNGGPYFDFDINAQGTISGKGRTDVDVLEWGTGGKTWTWGQAIEDAKRNKSFSYNRSAFADFVKGEGFKTASLTKFGTEDANNPHLHPNKAGSGDDELGDSITKYAVSYTKAVQSEPEQFESSGMKVAKSKPSILDRFFSETLNAKKSSGFGQRNVAGYGDYHTGVDYDTFGKSRPILSPIEGKVVKTLFSKDTGKSVIVKDWFGNTHHFDHLASRNVNPGQLIQAYDVIGKAGQTGKANGTHLHYEIMDKKSQSMDPDEYLKLYGAFGGKQNDKVNTNIDDTVFKNTDLERIKNNSNNDTFNIKLLKLIECIIKLLSNIDSSNKNSAAYLLKVISFLSKKGDALPKDVKDKISNVSDNLANENINRLSASMQSNMAKAKGRESKLVNTDIKELYDLMNDLISE